MAAKEDVSACNVCALPPDRSKATHLVVEDALDLELFTQVLDLLLRAGRGDDLAAGSVRERDRDLADGSHSSRDKDGLALLGLADELESVPGGLSGHAGRADPGGPRELLLVLENAEVVGLRLGNDLHPREGNR